MTRPVPADGASGAVRPDSLRAMIALARAALDVAAGPEHVLRVAVAQASAALGEPCTGWLYGTDEAPPVMAGDHPPDLTNAIRCIPGGTGGAVRVLCADRPDGTWLGGYGLAQCVLAPLRYGDREAGTLAVTRAAGRGPFQPADLDLLTAIADLAGVVTQQTRMLSGSVHALEDLRQLVDVVDRISDALVSCDAAYQIVNWNVGAEQVYGYSRSEALGCDLFALLGTVFYTLEGIETSREEALRRVALDGCWRGELRQRRADGAPLIILASLSTLLDPFGRPAGLVAVNRDVTVARHVEHCAMHDPLTGLPNRRLLGSELYEGFARACRTHCTLAVLSIDLDGFRGVNDRYGHEAGDEILKATAQRLITVLRSRDIVGRLSGDQFVAILEEAGNLASTESIAWRVADALTEPLRIGTSVLAVRASIGIAVLENPGSAARGTPESLLAAATTAMGRAKREGRGIIVAPPLASADDINGPPAPT